MASLNVDQIEFQEYARRWLEENRPPPPGERLPITPLEIMTTKFGDAAPLFDGSGNPPQPDFNDIAGLVQKFLAEPDAPKKAIAQLQPNVVYPDRPVDFKDIAADVQAFLGVAYSSVFFGPCVCPSNVTCGATACSNALHCAGVTPDGGLCIGGFCADPCGRCTP